MKAIEKGKIAVIGPGEMVLPFMAIGAEVFITDNCEEAGEAIHRFAGEQCHVILVSDDLLAGLEDIVSRFSEKSVPAITAIPGRSGRSSFSRERLNSMVRKAIGIDIEGMKEK